jgi:hypothetical protein
MVQAAKKVITFFLLKQPRNNLRWALRENWRIPKGDNSTWTGDVLQEALRAAKENIFLNSSAGNLRRELINNQQLGNYTEDFPKKHYLDFYRVDTA